MTPKELTRYGRVLYGRQWQVNLADGLGCSDRAVRYWLAGDRDIPPGLAADLRKLMQAKIGELQKTIAELK